MTRGQAIADGILGTLLSWAIVLVLYLIADYVGY